MIMIIACIISFVVGAMLMMCAIGMVAIQKDKKPRNKVRFYIAKPSKYYEYLYLGKPRRIFSNGKFLFKSSADKGRFITDNLAAYGLNPRDFDNMEEGEIREVFLNLED